MHSVRQQPFKTAVLVLVWGWLMFLVLAPNLLEALRSVAAIEGLVGHRSRLYAQRRRLADGWPDAAAPVPGSGGQAICGTQAASLRAAAFRP